MSWAAMQRHWGDSRFCRGFLLVTLAKHVNQDGVCWVSIKTLAQEMGCCVKTVKRGLGELETDGLIVEVSGYRYGGRGRSTTWKIAQQRVHEPLANLSQVYEKGLSRFSENPEKGDKLSTPIVKEDEVPVNPEAPVVLPGDANDRTGTIAPAREAEDQDEQDGIESNTVVAAETDVTGSPETGDGKTMGDQVEPGILSIVEQEQPPPPAPDDDEAMYADVDAAYDAALAAGVSQGDAYAAWCVGRRTIYDARWAA